MIIIYVTCKDESEAKEIGKALLEKRICGCVNIIPKMQSLYLWNGKILTAKETILIIKTHEKQFKEIEKCVLKMHSYEVPSIFSLSMQDISKPFEKWLLSSINI